MRHRESWLRHSHILAGSLMLLLRFMFGEEVFWMIEFHVHFHTIYRSRLMRTYVAFSFIFVVFRMLSFNVSAEMLFSGTCIIAPLARHPVFFAALISFSFYGPFSTFRTSLTERIKWRKAFYLFKRLTDNSDHIITYLKITTLMAYRRNFCLSSRRVAFPCLIERW